MYMKSGRQGVETKQKGEGGGEGGDCDGKLNSYSNRERKVTDSEVEVNTSHGSI